jgi:ferritin-like metal-binding protein YciE
VRPVEVALSLIKDHPKMPSKEKTLADLFLETLKDVYYAEKQAVRMLGTAAKAAKADQLRQAFEQHREESRTQVERLEQVFDLLDKPARGKSCEAIQGLNAEMAEILEDFGDSPAADAALIGAAQAVEHYEIARYGTLSTWANQLGLGEAATLLEETLAEEKKTDERLTQLARSDANPQAEQTGSTGEDDDKSTKEEAAGEPKAKAKTNKARRTSAK